MHQDQIEPTRVNSTNPKDCRLEKCFGWEGYLISEEYGNVEFFAETGETFEHLIQLLLSFRKFSTTRIVHSK
jgi:hypothetical protein